MYIMSLIKEAQIKIQKIFHGSCTKIHKRYPLVFVPLTVPFQNP